MDLLGSVPALLAARGAERRTTMRAVARSLAYGGAALAVRSLKG